MKTKVILLSASFLVVPAITMAADNTKSDNTGAEFEEIIVTAQKYKQRLQDVPISISAVTAEQMKARGVSDLKGMQYAVPGLSLFEYGPNYQFIQLRGISTAIGAQTVGQYIDEIPIISDAQGAALGVRMLDMQRVEVLRGPQATLYGEGSMGGTIRYITADPDLEKISGSVEAELGTVKDGNESYKTNAVLSLPIVTDKLGIRLVGGYEKDGGWIDSTATGKENINNTKVTTFRSKLLAQPSDSARISLLYLHQETNQDHMNFGINRQTVSSVQAYNKDRYDLVNGIFSYDFGNVSFIDSMGYINRKNPAQYDFTLFYLPTLISAFSLPDGFITKVPYPASTNYRIYTNETRLSSQGNEKFNWTIGGNYRWSRTTSVTDVGTEPGTLPVEIFSTQSYLRSKSWGAFAEVNYNITEKLNALVGIRYYHDNRVSHTDSVSFGFPATDDNQGNFHSWNPRVNLRYMFSDTSMAYINVSKGFRSGGFNLTSAGGGVYTIPPTYKPDSVWTYEVGTKQQLLDRRLEFDASVYYSDWKDVQSNAFVPASALIVITNGGKVSGWGTDISVTARPTSGLTLSGTYSWNNLEFDTSTADKLKGDPVDSAVHNSFSASLDCRRPVFDGTIGFFRADYQHAGRAQITLRNFGGQIIHISSRDLVNLRAGLNFGNFEISFFADNVFDEDAPVVPGPFGVVVENVEQRPRTMGMNGKFNF